MFPQELIQLIINFYPAQRNVYFAGTMDGICSQVMEQRGTESESAIAPFRIRYFDDKIISKLASVSLFKEGEGQCWIEINLLSTQYIKKKKKKGTHHCVLASTETNMLYTFGSNVSGQLGIGAMNGSDVINEITFFRDNQLSIVDINCGHNYVLVLTGTNDIYGWGSIRSAPSRNARSADVRLSFSLSYMLRSIDPHIDDHKYYISKISCSDFHSFVIVKNRYPEVGEETMYFMGWGRDISSQVSLIENCYSFCAKRNTIVRKRDLDESQNSSVPATSATTTTATSPTSEKSMASIHDGLIIVGLSDLERSVLNGNRFLDITTAPDTTLIWCESMEVMN
ncbi:NIMA-related kinase 8-like protein [Reticulomyxa filosa]|uniref:NIMA-related kinase 8-like protein n=1 Tax=Reticulomyxa filosa TaxID=46433 RepID=X6MCQ7_RETFI|nr:NIMA-related kinase 8-like protein [Reticulomyxa filosa]|eukprot:ETO10820.1 NIMA-related kinase 8-like protein [Reticulomyxa filosa]